MPSQFTIDTMKQLLTLLLCFSLYGCGSTLLNQAGDTTPPYINLTNEEFTTVVGQPIDFSNITAYDEVDGLLRVMVSGYINYNEPGTYYPLLKTADTSGNEISVPITIHVKKADYVMPGDSKEIETVITTCSAQGARDNNQPCNRILQEDLDKYVIVFKNGEGEERCQNFITSDRGACEIIRTNDGTFWGYGYYETDEQPEEKTEAE